MEEKIDLEGLNKEQLMSLRVDLEMRLDEYSNAEAMGEEIEPDLIFKTQSSILMIDELLD